VNIPAVESNLESGTPSSFASFADSVRWLVADEPIEAQLRNVRTGLELSGFLITILLVALVVEMLLVRLFLPKPARASTPGISTGVS
jgi:hypothetical protein